MQIGLMAVNAKYVHTNLPLRYLRQRFLEPSQFSFFEYTINQQEDMAYAQLFEADLDVLLVSLYIWNGQWIHRVLSALKAVKPTLKILIGGPEAECQSDFKQVYPWADVLIRGDLDAVASHDQLNALLEAVEGTYDVGKNDLSDLPFPYTDEELNKKSMFYYESDRGCPFLCSFCMASEQKSGRIKPLAVVYEELLRFMASEAAQVKFVDRTFNANPDRAIAILTFILEHHHGDMNFHFELAPHLVTEDFLKVVRSAPDGLFQFELGLQSFHPETLRAICRHPDQQLSTEGTRALLACQTAHVHVDLIAGLPYETVDSFADGFNQLMALRPHMLQLGFLKLMKGTALYDQQSQYGYKTRHYAPYEVLETSSLSAAELIRLKGVEDIVEKYYNSHRFDHALSHLLMYYNADAFKLYENMAQFKSQSNLSGSLSATGDYELLLAFAENLSLQQSIFRNLLLLDYLTHYSTPTTFFKPESSKLPESIHEALRSPINQKKLLEDDFIEALPVKDLLKRGQVGLFTIDLDDWIKDGAETSVQQAYFVLKHKNSKHALPRYAYLRV